MMDRSLACADPFLDMLIDLRAKHDLPPNIAAKMTADKPTLMEMAKKKLAVDAVDPKRTATCQQVVKTMPADKVESMVADMQACLAKEGCGGFVSCMRPLQDKRFAEKKAELSQKVAACTKIKTKIAECVGPFTEVVVSVQGEMDFPKGTADVIKKDRATLVAQTRELLAAKVTADKIEPSCLAEMLQTPPELMKTAEELMKTSSECVEKADCAEFAACMKPVQKRQVELAQKQLATAGE